MAHRSTTPTADQMALPALPMESPHDHYSLNSMLVTDEQGTPVKIIGSMRNITARKKAEKELTQYREQLEELVKERTADLEKANRKLLLEIEQRLRTEAALGENEAKYRSILENIEEGYFETDLRGNFTFHNDATSRILGWSRSELLGMNIRKYTDRKTARRGFRIFAMLACSRLGKDKQA